MKIMTCPLNGPRNISEFVCYGEVKPPIPAEASGAEVGRALYLEDNLAGIVFEWWIHVPSTYVFVAQRDTRTDEIVRTLTVAAFERERRA
jgi:sarcosine oxidase subunit delta